MQDNPPQPGRKAGIAAEAFQVGKGADIGFLHCVLGLGVVAQDASRESVEPAIVGLHDGTKGGFVTRQRSPDQSLIAGSLRSDLRRLTHDVLLCWRANCGLARRLDAKIADRFPLRLPEELGNVPSTENSTTFPQDQLRGLVSGGVEKVASAGGFDEVRAFAATKLEQRPDD